MKGFYRLFLFLALCASEFHSDAFARLPETKAEQSLLYWRYLCREEPQEEKIQNQMIEFKCKTQGWKVRAPASTGQIKEVIE